MRRKQQAFTLIELMIVVLIAAIILGVAIPSFTAQMQSNRSIALGEELVNTLNFARAEAVKRNARVSVCASSTGIDCTNDWTEGWIVFVDSAVSDIASPPVVAAETDVLRVWEAVDERAVITVSNNKQFIRYTGTGMLGRVDNNAISLFAGLTGCQNMAARRVTVSLSGSVNVARAVCQE